MNVNFYLDKPKENRSVIMILVTMDGRRIRSKSGISIESKYWDKNKKNVKRSHPKSFELNSALTKLENEINDFFYTKQASNESVKFNEMKSFVKRLFKKDEEVVDIELSFTTFFENFIEQREKSNQFSTGTIKQYRRTLNHILKYQSRKKIQLDFDDMTKEFYDDFMFYLNSGNKAMTNNSAGCIIKILKTFLNWALEKNYHNNTEFIRAFKVDKKDGITVALTKEEVDSIEALELDNERLKKVRDLFLMEINLGLRISDFKNLKPENFFLDEGFVKVHAIKNREPLTIPISKTLMKILDKYPDFNFPFISEPKYREYIKELCKLADIDTPIQRPKYYGKKRVDETLPKYEMISTHTAKRTFITLMLKNGALPESIMKVTGNKSRAVFQKYVRLTEDEAADDVRKALEKMEG